MFDQNIARNEGRNDNESRSGSAFVSSFGSGLRGSKNEIEASQPQSNPPRVYVGCVPGSQSRLKVVRFWGLSPASVNWSCNTQLCGKSKSLKTAKSFCK